MTPGLPPEGIMSTDSGLVENHMYRDLRGYDFDDYLRIQDHERQVLDYEGDPESDEAYYDLQDNEVYTLNLDAGVASLVIALAATGCCPVTSCSGDPGHTEEPPLVFFWSNGTEAKKVQEACLVAGAHFGCVRGGFLVWHPSSYYVLMDVAQELYNKRAQ